VNRKREGVSYTEVRVKVTPNARKEAFEMQGDTAIRMSVREPSEENRANTRVRELIGEHFRVPAKNVHIVRGHRSPNKIIRIIT
jgi:uncharacterized protein (TIGR00251 family)